MKLFFELEIAYIFIAIFFLIVTAIVTTRKFSPPNSFKKVFPPVLIFLIIAIFAHFKVTTSRMAEVESEFLKVSIAFFKNIAKNAKQIDDHREFFEQYQKSIENMKNFYAEEVYYSTLGTMRWIQSNLDKK